MLVMAAILLTQLGASLAKQLFSDVGPGGTVFLRLAFGAVILSALSRPRLRGHGRRGALLIVVFGLTFAGMNGAFYASIDRIPLGVAVTIEFIGPLAVGLLGSRRPLDLVWVALAAAGIVLLGDGIGEGTDLWGVALALLAGVFWGAYILLTGRVGRRFDDGAGLALALVVAAVAVAPLGLAQGGLELLDPSVLAIGLVVAIVSSALPYSFELEALRRLRAATFGVLMSLEPATAALVGVLVLGEALRTSEWLAVVMVVLASAGAARGARVVPVHE
jgi:inner membrane transporter RhtA